MEFYQFYLFLRVPLCGFEAGICCEESRQRKSARKADEKSRRGKLTRRADEKSRRDLFRLSVSIFPAGAQRVSLSEELLGGIPRKNVFLQNFCTSNEVSRKELGIFFLRKVFPGVVSSTEGVPHFRASFSFFAQVFRVCERFSNSFSAFLRMFFIQVFSFAVFRVFSRFLEKRRGIVSESCRNRVGVVTELLWYCGAIMAESWRNRDSENRVGLILPRNRRSRRILKRGEKSIFSISSSFWVYKTVRALSSRYLHKRIT